MNEVTVSELLAGLKHLLVAEYWIHKDMAAAINDKDKEAVYGIVHAAIAGKKKQESKSCAE